MDNLRKPFQGVWNIIRFNWPFYITAIVLLCALSFWGLYIGSPFEIYTYTLCILIAAGILLSLVVSFYIYDLSGLYRFSWMDTLKKDGANVIVNVNAGFDETSVLLHQKFPHASLAVFDFYDPVKHTERSIKRARKAYPPYPGTLQAKTTSLPLPNYSVDKIFVIFAAHEIRNERERLAFFKELKRILKPGGEIIVTEHLRDLPNFLAYNFGFFHFYPKHSWHAIFKAAGIAINREIKLAPFISTFILSS